MLQIHIQHVQQNPVSALTKLTSNNSSPPIQCTGANAKHSPDTPLIQKKQ